MSKKQNVVAPAIMYLLMLTNTQCVSGGSRVDRCVSSVNSCQGIFLDSSPKEPSVRGFQKIKDLDENWQNGVDLWGVPEGETKSVYIGRLTAEPIRDKQDKVVRGEVSITYIEVEPKFRGLGAQDAMFSYYLSKNPTVKKIYTGLADTNAAVFRNELIKQLKEMDPHFNGNIKTKLESLPQQEADALLKRAYQKTPAAKSRKKFNLEPCNEAGSISVLDYNAQIFSVFVTTCR